MHIQYSLFGDITSIGTSDRGLSRGGRGGGMLALYHTNVPYYTNRVVLKQSIERGRCVSVYNILLDVVTKYAESNSWAGIGYPSC